MLPCRQFWRWPVTEPNSPNPCPHCKDIPSLRTDSATGFFMVACIACKVYTEATSSNEAAIGYWNNFAQEHRACLGCGSQPTIKHSKLRQMWVYQCTGCNWQGNLSHSSQGALCDWHRSNTPGDMHIMELWQMRAAELQNQA